jgi:hypothetical protein
MFEVSGIDAVGVDQTTEQQTHEKSELLKRDLRA